MSRRAGGRNGFASRGSRVVVTGAAGFIGSHLCERLLAEGHSVWGIDNFDSFYAPATKRANLAGCRSHPHMHVVEGDIRDGVLLNGLFSDVPVDAVIHLAARAGVRPSIEDPKLCLEVNVRGTLTLLEAMHDHHVRCLVFGSSSSVYGNSARAPFREAETADQPISPYAASKRAGEMLCHTYHHLYAMSACCLRFFTVYGPRQRPDLAIHKFARLLAAGKSLPLYGNGTSRRDYTYIDDIIDGVVLALQYVLKATHNGAMFEVLNLGRSDPIALSQLVAQLAEAMEIQPTIERLPMQPGDVEMTCACVEAAEALIGYRPRVEFQDGLRRFVEWFQSEQQRSIEPREAPVVIRSLEA